MADLRLLGAALLAWVQLAAAQAQCVDDTSSPAIDLSQLISASGQQLDTPFGTMFVNPCEAIASETSGP